MALYMALAAAAAQGQLVELRPAVLLGLGAQVLLHLSQDHL